MGRREYLIKPVHVSTVHGIQPKPEIRFSTAFLRPFSICTFVPLHSPAINSLHHRSSVALLLRYALNPFFFFGELQTGSSFFVSSFLAVTFSVYRGCIIDNQTHGSIAAVPRNFRPHKILNSCPTRFYATKFSITTIDHGNQLSNGESVPNVTNRDAADDHKGIVPESAVASSSAPAVAEDKFHISGIKKSKNHRKVYLKDHNLYVFKDT
ncbi:hypothetical protein LXL04_010328 [Taraxacum kok-saghyz]